MIKIIQNISHNNLVYPVGDNINWLSKSLL
jgi:hypothetical protein